MKTSGCVRIRTQVECLHRACVSGSCGFFQALFLLGLGVLLIVVAPFLVAYCMPFVLEAIFCASVSLVSFRSDYWRQKIFDAKHIVFRERGNVSIDRVIVSGIEPRERDTC
ncbi:MAG: hypothetical protein ACREGH_02445 [Minisyncoccia bacterium]